MKTMQIFEPAMCCPTGLCGVGLDTELLRISAVVETLKKHGVLVERFNLNNAPTEFITHQTINDFINDKGPEGLPVIVLDDEIVLSGRYPANEELAEWLELPAELLKMPEESGSADCCCGSGRCF
ncbi:hypothetical protein AB840_00720 [Megasphaera cerevisiae DSM 20462]|jgi:hypothetical protein|uniref:Arsenic resistance operon repressor n=1 Tax=Megasphaera cerevisiae DSM 20462 TaxID=1122219 RepID=A0A0J6ZRV9_9FIRM|nr:arsenite efflux transporter metallochaperone ArsD [Megasphaera cerevisiae]KMO87691.1 hypothetical protein AB840_00720 [Megasphaera cerevisiae DSM 20462]OKY53440.1 arsenical resistance operon transcriptional repressor ArsD [Megasphaera cerevisiae]SJZ75996.1 Arsenical resistance operon trans-acting repressor ArsD [Megasphaera cerevisiae DSM 20462]